MTDNQYQIMGGDLSTQRPPPHRELTFVTDPRYGGTIAVDSSKTKAYQTFDVDEVSANHFKEDLLGRKRLNHPSFLTINRSWIEKYRQACSLEGRYKVTVEYIFIPECLQDRIIHYCGQQRPYPEMEVRQIFHDIVSCLQYLKQNNTCHGDIKPKNVLISSQGKAFLADSYLINRGRVSYEIVMEDPESLSLLSPQQLEKLREKKFTSLKDVHHDEIYAVGLTMLEAMTAEPAMECYDLANLKIKQGYFDRKYHEMRECGYSHPLSHLVMGCLEYDPQRRPTFAQFLDAIKR